MPTYVVTCNFCGTANRIPAEKEGKSGRCGNCHKELPPMYYRPQHLNEHTFDTFIKTYSGPVLADCRRTNGYWLPIWGDRNDQTLIPPPDINCCLIAQVFAKQKNEGTILLQVSGT